LKYDAFPEVGWKDSVNWADAREFTYCRCHPEARIEEVVECG